MATSSVSAFDFALNAPVESRGFFYGSLAGFAFAAVAHRFDAAGGFFGRGVGFLGDIGLLFVAAADVTAILTS